MQTRIIDLNRKEMNFEFRINVFSSDEWVDFAHQIIWAKGENVRNLELIGLKVVIRDNVAKVKIFYQDAFYHELEYYFDEFGRIDKQYKDVASNIWQQVMLSRYGEKYDIALRSKMNGVTKNI